MSYRQAGRPIAIETPLGDDVLLLTGFEGEEAVSRLFRFRLSMLSENRAIKPRDIVGKAVSVRIERADGEPRWFHGHIARFEAGWDTPQGLREYSAEMVPWLWFLTQTTDCRIFQNKTAKDIATTIFGEFGFGDHDLLRVIEEHPSWEYSVQYRESAFDYLSRLFEHQGIFFHFRHERNRHTLVLADSNTAFRDCVETDLGYSPAGGVSGEVSQWRHRYNFRPGRWSSSDYNFKEPGAPLRSDKKTLAPFPETEKYEHFEWPGDYYTNADGEALVRHRLEEMEAGFHEVEGESSCAGFEAGTRFRLARHPDPDEIDVGYALLAVGHTAELGDYLTADRSAYRYRNRFTAFPLLAPGTHQPLPYRPPRVTPKPVISGQQTAVVVGPSGEDIHCDEFARVKVQFHWDRHGRHDDSASCWVRVSQMWAGKGYGALHLPHIGQEVLVGFLEGDPDRPVITGRVYNQVEKNPLVAEALAYKSKSITKDQGGNRISTEGKAGGQAIEFFSPTSSTLIQVGKVDQVKPSAGAGEVINDGILLSTKGDYTSFVNNNIQTDVNGSQYVMIGADRYEYTKGNTREITEGDSYSITKGYSESYTEGNSSEVTVGDSKEYVRGNSNSIKYSSEFDVTMGASCEIKLGAESSITVGATSEVKFALALNINCTGTFAFTLLNRTFLDLFVMEAAIKENKFNLNRTEAAAAKAEADLVEQKATGMVDDVALLKKKMSGMEVSFENLDSKVIHTRMELGSVSAQVRKLTLHG